MSKTARPRRAGFFGRPLTPFRADPRSEMLGEFMRPDRRDGHSPWEEPSNVLERHPTTACFAPFRSDQVLTGNRMVGAFARPREILAVDIPRPRDLRVKRDPRFIEIERRIWESIREEAVSDGLVATA